jgi:flagellar protein FlbD
MGAFCFPNGDKILKSLKGLTMVPVTRLNGQEVYVNADLILFLEKSPETILTLQNGKKITVKDSIPQVIEKIVEFKSRCYPKIYQAK